MDLKNPEQAKEMADGKTDLGLHLDSGLGLSFDPSEELTSLPVEKFENLRLEDSCQKSTAKQGFDLFAQDKDGDSLLHIAICKKLEDKAFQIINHAQSLDNLNLKNNYGQTPLILAVQFGMYSLVRYLIDCGVDVESVEYKDMNNIVHFAAYNKDGEMLKIIYTSSEYLTENTFKSLVSLLNAPNNAGFVPLHIAVQNKDINFIKLLMELQIDIEAKDLTAGYTGLHHAVLSGDANWLKVYISECRPCLDALSYADDTAYQLALQNDATEIMQILIEAGASTEM